MKIKVKYLNKLILVLLFPILIIDMLNGFILEKGMFLSFSISQLYKLILLGLMLFRLITAFQILKLIGALFFIFLSGTLFRFFFNGLPFSILLEDITMIFKYLMSIISFFYFREVIYLNNMELLVKYIRWIKYSYFILATNILVKLIGLGYPMYGTGIGTRGFFHAGNEISALLLVLSAILGYHYWEIQKQKVKSVFCLIMSFTLGLLISSKTAILGVILIFMLIIFDKRRINFRYKEFIKSVFLVLGLLPIFVFSGYLFIVKSSIMIRFTHFWTRLDFFTFIMSSRNTYLKKMIVIYNEKYSWTEKLIGGGHTYYKELLGQMIEIDPMDIFFAYGYVGVTFFIGLIVFLLIYAKVLLDKKKYPYARLSYFMTVVLVLLSCLSGHVINSGISAVFIGFLFSLMFVKYKKL